MNEMPKNPNPNFKAKGTVDFERASLLMNFIVTAGQHGPLYQVLAGKAQEELKKMVEDTEKGDKIVTPAAGPANSAVQREDGSIEQLPQTPADEVGSGLDQAKQDQAARREGKPSSSDNLGTNDPTETPEQRQRRLDANRRIFPEGSGVREERDPPPIQRRVL